MGKGWVGSDWGFNDGQVLPCMDRCMGGCMEWCMGRGGCSTTWIVGLWIGEVGSSIWGGGPSVMVMSLMHRPMHVAAYPSPNPQSDPTQPVPIRTT